MRVLAVTNMYPTASNGGSGIFVEQQVAGLRRIGVDIDVEFVDRVTRGMTAYAGVPALVKHAIARTRPDLVHVMYGGVLADLVTRVVNDRPTVVTFHGSDLLGERLAGPLRRLFASYGVLSSHRAARRASGVVIVSDALRQEVRGRVDDSRIRLIPCGIDLERFKPLDREACRRQLAWPLDDRLHVLFNAGGCDPVKRPDLARAAVARLNETGVRAELHEMTGVRNEDVVTWLNASDVLILTSLHEGSPTIVKEALACNLPVVSVDVGDVRHRLQGIDGCHVSGPTPEDLAATLRLVARGTRRVASRSRVADLSLECIAQQLAAFYRELLGEATGAVRTVEPTALDRSLDG